MKILISHFCHTAAFLSTTFVSVITFADWDGQPPFEQIFPQEHQFLAACRQGRDDVVQYWLEEVKLDPNTSFSSGFSGNDVAGIYLAARNGHEEVVDKLLEKRANPFAPNKFLLFFAMTPKQEAIAAQPFKRSSNPEKYDRYARIANKLSIAEDIWRDENASYYQRFKWWSLRRGISVDGESTETSYLLSGNQIRCSSKL